MKRLWIAILLVVGAAAQTRPVIISWVPSTTTGVTGYNVSRGTSASGPFTLLNAAPVTTTSYTDSAAAVSATYTYQVVAVGPPCTPTMTTACGSSAPATATTNVPPQPAVTFTVTITVP